VRLRRWQRGDVAAAAEGKALDEDGALAWIEMQSARQAAGAALALAITDAGSDEALGCLTLNARIQPGTVARGTPEGLVFEVQAGTAGIGYWMLARGRRRGFATAAVALLTRWAMAEGGLRRIEGLVEPHNVASIRVLERCGFRREGLLRDFLEPGDDGRRGDAYVYSLLASDAPKGV
jgi:[ribosomal protein S5]-alanine N-acetyltransferase